MIPLPTELRRGLVGFGDEGLVWVDELPARIDRLCRRWHLDLGPPFEPGGVTSWVAPAGDDAVLKVVVPHREATYEAHALRSWAGHGAVRQLDEDPAEHALLLERCRPGTALRKAGRSDDEVLDIGTATAVRLWQRPSAGDPYERLADVMAEWAAVVEERAATVRLPVDEAVVAEAAALLRRLPATADREVLLHGDLHPANLLAAEREPWLAIDPKPMRGDPAFDLAPLVLQTGDLLAAVDPATELDRRLGRVAAATGTDPDRIRAWGLARAVDMVVWRGDEPPEPHLDAAAWTRLLAR
ncbi:MAG TPA: aminoglycoside phosphotransferase family protein [Acidimicrobiales bacterium]|nr:aminoglycoside phosphotransferase family protein [Acidimicrobiales bacterium]